jgi:predicted Zn-dependent protease
LALDTAKLRGASHAEARIVDERQRALATKNGRIGSASVVKSQQLHLVPEPPHVAEWASPCKIDPFGITTETNLDLLFAVDAEMRKVKGVTVAWASMNFRRIVR